MYHFLLSLLKIFDKQSQKSVDILESSFGSRTERWKWLLAQIQKFEEKRVDVSVFYHSLMEFINPRLLVEMLKNGVVFTCVLQVDS
jgi:hypothetical protein